MGNDMFQFIAGYFIDYIERSTSGSKLKSYYADIMASNNYSNREFSNLVQNFIDLIPEFEDSIGFRIRDSRDVEDILVKFSPDYLLCNTAYILMGDRDVCNSIDDRVYHDLEAGSRRWEELYSGRRNSSSRFNTPVTNSYSNYSNNSRAGSRFDTGGRGNRINTNVISNKQMGTNNKFVNVNTRQNLLDDRFDNPITEAKRSMAKVESKPVEPPTQSKVVSKEVVVNRPNTKYRKDVTESQIALMEYFIKGIEGLEEGLDPTLREPYNRFKDRGTLIEATAVNKWQIKQVQFDNTAKNYSYDDLLSFYDINRTIQLIQTDGEKINEVTESMTPDKRYLAHELMYNELSKEKPMTKLDVKMMKERDPDIQVEPASAPLGDILSKIDYNSFSKGHMVALTNFEEHLIQARLDLAKSDRSAIVYKGFTADPLYIRGDVKYAKELIGKLNNSMDLLEANEKLGDIRRAGFEEIFAKINDRFNKALLPLLANQWLLPLKSFNFYEHLDELLLAIKEKQGNDTVKTFKDRTGGIIREVSGIIKDSEYESFLSHFEGATPDSPIIAFEDFSYIVAIKQDSDESGIGRQLEGKKYGVAVRSLEATEALPNSLRDIYYNLPISDLRKRNTVLRIAPSDNQIINVYPFNGRTNEFILSLT